MENGNKVEYKYNDMKTLQKYILEAKTTPEHQNVIDTVYNTIEKSLTSNDVEVNTNISRSGKESDCSITFMNKIDNEYTVKIKLYLNYNRFGLSLSDIYIGLWKNETSIVFESLVSRICPTWKPKFKYTFKRNKGYIVDPNNYNELVEFVLNFDDIVEDIKKSIYKIIKDIDDYREAAEDIAMNQLASKPKSREDFLQKYPISSDAYRTLVRFNDYLKDIIKDDLETLLKKI